MKANLTFKWVYRKMCFERAKLGSRATNTLILTCMFTCILMYYICIVTLVLTHVFLDRIDNTHKIQEKIEPFERRIRDTCKIAYK